MLNLYHCEKRDWKRESLLNMKLLLSNAMHFLTAVAHDKFASSFIYFLFYYGNKTHINSQET
jgi:hypothetical protein